MKNTETDIIDILNRRSVLLESISKYPARKRTLVDELDTSRSTIDRGIRDLETLGLVKYESGLYSLTSVGQFIETIFFDFQESVTVATNLAPFLEWMDPEWFDVNLSSLRDAQVFVADSNDSFGPWDWHAGTVRTTQLYRALLPSVGREPMEIKYRTIVENESELDVIVSHETAEKLQSEPLVDVFEDMLETGRVTVYVCDEPIPYYIGIFDNVVQVGCCGNHGIPHTLLETSAPECVTWAENKFNSYQTRSELLSY
ncbi:MULTISPECIES: winged helix-turn-helix domain-containing protein [Haloferax]|uniref:Uncharacterized protein n=2 Tax=Haloferax TaxID=2251 RepID=A0A6G1Z1D7_9EURY|nr:MULTISPECIES: hypothetical protein [Haloferax]KAB1187686.1 hypothetical protein Hfx1149_06425 [Haloferax sp. CBA1149]MRW80346.1 hypothetical protein [Haloferax marinisediminis]